MSRMNHRSPPSSRWRTFSDSSGRRTAQASLPLVHQESYKHTGPSDFPPDNYRQRRFPMPSHRFDFPADMARRRSSFQTATSSPPRNFRPERQSRLPLRNQKSPEAGSFSKTYYRPLRDSTARPASPPRKFPAVLKNNKSKLYFSGMKRSSDVKDFAEFPPAKLQKRNMEDRQDVSYQSRASSRLNSSNVLWCRPPCRQRTRSRDRKSDSAPHGPHTDKSCPDRDSTLNQRQARLNLKRDCPAGDEGHNALRSKDGRGQQPHPDSWRQFSSNKLSGNLEVSVPWSRVQRSSPRLQRKSREGVAHIMERRNSSESRRNIQHSQCADQSAKIPYNVRNRNEISSTQNHRFQVDNFHHQSQKPSTINNVQDDHRLQGSSFSSERDTCHKTKSQGPQKRSHDSFERKSRDSIRQGSPRNSTCSRGSSSIESFSEADRSFPNIGPQERSRRRSSSSARSSRSHSVDKVASSPSDRSVDRDSRSVDSPFSGSDVKAKVSEFNPDYVVIIRRANEGARPLCMREEFSAKSSTLVSNEEQLPAAANSVNISDRSTSSPMVLVDKIRKDDCSNSEFSPAAEESSVKLTKAPAMQKIQEEAEEVMNIKPVTTAFHKSSRTVTNTTSSVLAKKDVADERTRPNSFDEQRVQEQAGHSSKAVEEEASFASKKSAFDLRQKIAERRQLRTEKNPSTKIVRSWPNRLKNLPQASFRNLACGSRATELKHSFVPRKRGPRHSVVLK